MTSRPGPGIQESLQHGAIRPQVRRRPSRPLNTQYAPSQDLIDPTLLEDRKPPEPPQNPSDSKGSIKLKPGMLDGLQIGPSDNTKPSPRGKPQLFYASLASGAHDAGLHSPQGQPASTSTNMPMPPRPVSSLQGNVQQARRVVPGGTGVKESPGVKPQAAEVPASAVVFSGGKTADLFPWTGNNPEDTLSEALVKAGINNKPQIMNETNTARVPLWPSLKNKSGLSTLSTLFVAVLEKRQQSGRLTTPNTFKPPPRLTLKDSKREEWLHDLANPTVSLRRLGRTIPHGITGKVLLEQCLNKNIPIPRAMWLAKAIGINEMRSHKRKGQAGTLTWIRGWTSAVEQFLDSIVATIGQQDWKPRITYALRLVTNIYRDQLLEDEHFLDWLLKSLETSPPERLFLWLLYTSVHWQDLTGSRRRGKRLAEALLKHAERLHQGGDLGVNSPILPFLENTILKLLVTRSACLLLPNTWDHHGPALRAIVEKRGHPQLSHFVAHLDRRNRRLMRQQKTANTGSKNPTSKVFALLDSVDYGAGVSIDGLSSECMQLVSDIRSLVSTVLQWASSLHREGVHRIYLVTRLLRKWCNVGADVDDAVLSFLHTVGSRRSIEPRNVFRIVAELVRSKTFSVGKYLQWLIATGSSNSSQDLSSPSAWPLRLITEIPLTGLPDQVLNLRSTLLQNSNYSVEAEDQLYDDAQDAIQQQIPDLFDMAPLVEQPADINFANMSMTVRLELGIWLRQQVVANVEMYEHVPTKHSSIFEAGPVCTITASDFHKVRAYIEEFGDLSVLADIVGVVSTTLDHVVLTCLADTLHFHHRAFSAIGAFKPLFMKVAMRYAAIRTTRFPERELLVALADVARTAQADGQLMQMLAYDLSRCEQKNLVAACSPVSDNMDMGSNTGLDTDDEIDRILSSGTSMDQQIMSRVFVKVVSRLDEQVSKGMTQSDCFGSWFFRLRTFDEKAFEKISTDWLSSLLMNHQSKLVLSALPPLVASGCITLHQFLETCRNCISSRKSIQEEGAVRMGVEALNALLPTEHLNRLCLPQDAYRYRLEQRKLCQDFGSQILPFIRETIEFCPTQLSPSLEAQVSSLLFSNRLRGVVRHFAVRNMQGLSEKMGIGLPPKSDAVSARVKSLLDGLLDPASTLRLSKKSLQDQVTTIVDHADDLALPFCQLELQHTFAATNTQPDAAEDAASGALLEAIKLALEKDQSPWADLVAGLDGNLTSKIKEHAEREILTASASIFILTAPAVDDSSKQEEAFLRKYLTVVEFTGSKASIESQSSTFPLLVERLKGIIELLGKSTEASDPDSGIRSATTVSRLCLWLHALLQLSVVHMSTASPAKVGTQSQAAFLWALRTLFTHAALETYPATTEYLFDVATLFSDTAPEEVRNHLAKLDTAKANDDPQCAFIFGSAPPQDGWLALMKPIAAPPSSTSSPQLQPQLPSQGSTPQQLQSHQSFQSPSSSPMQRSLSQYQQQQAQAQNQARMYPQQQHPQLNKMPSFPRMPSGNSNPSQLQQMQQMQQMQQRAMQPSPIHGQRAAPPPPQTPGAAQGRPSMTGMHRQEKVEMRSVPFQLRRWEILPESGGNPAGNETAVSLGLFGARRV